jgi:uncharacterized protein
MLPTCLAAGLLVAVARHVHTPAATLVVAADHKTLLADGYAEVRLQARASDGSHLRTTSWQFEAGRNLAELEGSGSGVNLRAGVTPGKIRLLVTAPGFKPAPVDLSLELDPSDQFGDGTPDFLRLQDEDDRAAFRRWFTFLAESTYFQQEADRPPEVTDCAALIRFAYREALRRHDGPWANSWHLSSLPNVQSVRKYEYPHTPLGSGLFRTRPGAFTLADLTRSTFREFADAESLRRYNTHFLSRDLNAARPGDLLFFRQERHRMPFHTMIYLGRSYFGEGTQWLVYHTGPIEGHDGEIRRVTIGDLLHHPLARWRPLPQNPSFQGVYRWNLLREAD